MTKPVQPKDLPDEEFFDWCVERAEEGVNRTTAGTLAGWSGGQSSTLGNRLMDVSARLKRVPPVFAGGWTPRKLLKVRRNGRRAVRLAIGGSYLRRIGLDAGDRVLIEVENGALVIRKASGIDEPKEDE